MKARALLAATVGLLLLPLAAHAATPEPPQSLSTHQSAVAELPSRSDSRFVQLKLKEQAGLKLIHQRFVANGGHSLPELNGILSRSRASLRPLFAGGPASLRSDAAQLRRAGHKVPDLSQWYDVRFPSPIAASAAADKLATLPEVAEAYVPAPVVLPVTPDFRSLQQYRAQAPTGVGDLGVSDVIGADGTGVKVVDIEYSWNLEHEDLTAARSALMADGRPCDPFKSTHHGTAVLGVIAADENPTGVTGIAPEADLGVVNTARKVWGGYCRVRPGRAINLASSALSPGDVILIELSTYGADNELLPMEWDTATYDAIRTATAKGVVVIEAAGNGGVDLDDPKFGTAFPEGKPDSGAIMVGASYGCGGSTAPAGFSDFGERVDVYALGGCVTTTGYGDLFGTQVNDYYTDGFSGTSSASAIVAGVSAAVLGEHEATHGSPMSPEALRDLLVATGTASDQAYTNHIGTMPNLQAALLGDFRPSAPLGLTATGSDVGVRLTWDASTEGDLASYEVYRYNRSSVRVKIATIPGSRTSFLDKKAQPGANSDYELKAVDEGGQTSDLVEVNAIRTGPGVWQEASATYTGGWEQFSCDCHSGGAAMRSSEAGATARFSFTGSRISVISSVGPTMGAVKIFLDGNSHGTWSLDSYDPHYARVLWSKGFASPGSHTLRLVAVEYQGNTRIDVDAFAVQQ